LEALEQKGIELLQLFAFQAKACGVKVDFFQANGSVGFMIYSRAIVYYIMRLFRC